jgi:type I restriction-modification system DNA methylase subunit
MTWTHTPKYATFFKELNKIAKKIGNGATEEGLKSLWVKQCQFNSAIEEKVDLFVEPGIIFEFKLDKSNLIGKDRYKVLAQALTYVYRIFTGKIKLAVPQYIVLLDVNEGLILDTYSFLQILTEGKKYDWKRSASNPCKKLVSDLTHIDPAYEFSKHFTSEAQLKEFVEELRRLVNNPNAAITKKLITKDNYASVFEEWASVIGCHIGKDNLGPYFYNDVKEHAFLIATGKLYFSNFGESFDLPKIAYEGFWKKYTQPASNEALGSGIASQHMQMAEKARRETGSFYTPIQVAEKGKEYLDKVLGANWEDEYYIWDPCCGTCNLEVPLKNTDKVFVSELCSDTVKQVKSMGLFNDDQVFQFDFLNGEYKDLPKKLRDVIEGGKKLLVLMNPPYAEGAGGVGGENHKAEVSNTVVGKQMVSDGMGKAANELFNQFIYRVSKWCPKAHIGLYSTLKYVNAPNTVEFREKVMKNFSCLTGFAFPATLFSGVKGAFPIAFTVWSQS